MSIKILITNSNQHIIADVKQVENEETKALVAYWLKGARLVQYGQAEDGGLAVNFINFCPLATEAEFAILQPNQILAILDPQEKALEAYNDVVNPAPAEAAVEGAEAPVEAAPEAPAAEVVEEDIPTVSPEVV